MDVQTIFYHARFELLRNVLNALGPDRVEKGMTAFEDGASTWSQCFFARAFDNELNLNQSDPEKQIQRALGLKTIVPIRFTWRAFDSAKTTGINRETLKKMCRDIISETENKDVEALIASLSDVDLNREITLECVRTNA